MDAESVKLIAETDFEVGEMNSKGANAGGKNHMRQFRWTIAVGVLLAGATTARGQVVGGVISVTQSHMS